MKLLIFTIPNNFINNWLLQKNHILKGLYHRRVYAACLQIDPESYEWGLSVRSVDLKRNP